MKELPQDQDNVGKEDINKPVETKSISRKHVIEKSKSGIMITKKRISEVIRTHFTDGW